jgi:hypothetical protein
VNNGGKAQAASEKVTRAPAKTVLVKGNPSVEVSLDRTAGKIT